jgi:hypothetical protein
MRSWGYAPSFSAQVRPHGKPGQVGEPGAPLLLLKGTARSEVKPQVPRLPEFPVKLGGVGRFHAAFFTESRTRGRR